MLIVFSMTLFTKDLRYHASIHDPLDKLVKQKILSSNSFETLLARKQLFPPVFPLKFDKSSKFRNLSINHLLAYGAAPFQIISATEVFMLPGRLSASIFDKPS